MAILKGAEVVSKRREGTWVYYSLHPNLPLWASHLLSAVAKEASALCTLDFVSLEERVRTPTCCDKASAMQDIKSEILLENVVQEHLFQETAI